MTRAMLKSILAWALGLFGLWALPGFILGTRWAPLHDVADALGLAFAFTAYAGGLALGARHVPIGRKLFRPVLALAGISVGVWLLLAYAAPAADYSINWTGAGDTRYPFGARTPPAYRMLRDSVETLSLVEYSPGADQPTRWAPAWINYRLTRPRAVAALVPLGALLGLLVARATEPLPPGRRRRLRWIAGLVNATAFLAAHTVLWPHLLANPAGSGWGRSWALLAPVMVFIGAATAVVAGTCDR